MPSQPCVLNQAGMYTGFAGESFNLVQSKLKNKIGRFEHEVY